MAKGDGLIVMKPTSIVVAGAGSSASINTDGGVDFTSATSLSLNGVFTASYSNYVIIAQTSSSTSGPLWLRYRTAGTDATGATDYTSQYLAADATVVGSARASDSYARSIRTYTSPTSGTLYVYGPAIAQPTASRSITVANDSSAYISDAAATHNQSVSYDGCTFIVYSSGNMTGSVVVMGYEE